MTWQSLVAFATPVAFYLILGALNLLLGHRSQIDAWAEANPRLAAVMKLSRSLGLDPWMFIQSASLFIRGRLPVTMTEPKRTTIKPPPLALMLLGLLLVSCGGSQPQPNAVAELAPMVCRLSLLQARFAPAEVERICADSAVAARLATDLTQVVVKAAAEAQKARADVGPGAPGWGDGGTGGAK